MPRGDFVGQSVLVLAPTGRDAALISAMLSNEGLTCVVCQDVGQLAAGVEGGADLGLMAEEALVGISLEPLLRAITGQPAWSDFPFLFLTTNGTLASETSMNVLRVLGAEGNITILERPVRLATLLNGVQSALRGRRRQYQVREYLEERKRHQEELLQTQKLESLGVMAGGIAHDFNNLLTGILGNASLLENLPDADDRECAENIMKAAERAADLTKQMLAYSGKGRFVIRATNLSAQVREILPLIQPMIDKKVEVALVLAEQLPDIESDRGQLQQLIMNLVINGAEAMGGAQGRVIVTTSAIDVDETFLSEVLSDHEIPVGRYVCLEVRDTGMGMSEETKSKIFDPFFTTKFTGRGLGLAAVSGIVRGHKGALRVYSSLGQGTTFKIFLPALAVKGGDGSSKPRPDSGAGTVLLVDDEETVRKVGRICLEGQGFRVLLACNGREAVELFQLRSGEIALVILDMTMPVMSGQEALRLLREIRPEVPVIVCSGYNEAQVLRKLTEQGVGCFIQKPYSSSTLLQKVNWVMERVKHAVTEKERVSNAEIA